MSIVSSQKSNKEEKEDDGCVVLVDPKTLRQRRVQMTANAVTLTIAHATEEDVENAMRIFRRHINNQGGMETSLFAKVVKLIAEAVLVAKELKHAAMPFLQWYKGSIVLVVQNDFKNTLAYKAKTLMKEHGASVALDLVTVDSLPWDKLQTIYLEHGTEWELLRISDQQDENDAFKLSAKDDKVTAFIEPPSAPSETKKRVCFPKKVVDTCTVEEKNDYVSICGATLEDGKVFELLIEHVPKDPYDDAKFAVKYRSLSWIFHDSYSVNCFNPNKSMRVLRIFDEPDAMA